jgi:hypothetical protein
MRKFEIPLERLLTAEFAGGEGVRVQTDGEEKMFYTHIDEMLKETKEREFLVVDVGVNHLRMQLISELSFTVNILVFRNISM